MTAETETTELSAVAINSVNGSYCVVGEWVTVFSLSKPGVVSPAHGFTSGFSTPSFDPGGFILGMWRTLKRHFFILCPPCYPVSNGRGLFGGVG
jgi:hypothetical protein